MQIRRSGLSILCSTLAQMTVGKGRRGGRVGRKVGEGRDGAGSG